MPCVDAKAAELLFRHKVIVFLSDEELLTEERIELLLSWQNTGFSVHNSVTVGSEDAAGTERLARYLLRPALSLERMSWDGDGSVLYRRKAPGRFGGSQNTFDAMDFLARLLMQVPQPTPNPDRRSVLPAQYSPDVWVSVATEKPCQIPQELKEEFERLAGG